MTVSVYRSNDLAQFLPVQALERIGKGRARFLLRLLRLLGFSILFWTVNAPESLPLLRPYASIIVTDEVELIVRACAAENGSARG